MPKFIEIDEKHAIALYESRFWESMTHRDIAAFQLWTDRLCMPFGVFHEAVEKALGRPVFTHEFGVNMDGLRKELAGDMPAPTLEQVIEMIPAEKRVILVV